MWQAWKLIFPVVRTTTGQSSQKREHINNGESLDLNPKVLPRGVSGRMRVTIAPSGTQAPSPPDTSAPQWTQHSLSCCSSAHFLSQIGTTFRYWEIFVLFCSSHQSEFHRNLHCGGLFGREQSRLNLSCPVTNCLTFSPWPTCFYSFRGKRRNRVFPLHQIQGGDP